MLCREYFPYIGQKMTPELEDWMTHYYDFFTAYQTLLRGDWKENTTVKVSASGVSVNKWEPVNQRITQLTRDVEGRKVIHLLNFCTQESDKVTDPAYLLCWHDRDGLRPWPVEHKQLALTISSLTGVRRIGRLWVASPDYIGGAVQEITDYSFASGTLRFTLPALQFWTMIVVEPETSSPDALIQIPAKSTTSSKAYTLSGIPFTSSPCGIVVKNGRKTMVQ
jgi:dextranase